MYEDLKSEKELYYLEHVDDYDVGANESKIAVTNYETINRINIEERKLELEERRLELEENRDAREAQRKLEQDCMNDDLENRRLNLEEKRIETENKKSKRELWGKVIAVVGSFGLSLLGIFYSDIKNSMKTVEPHINRNMNKV